MIALDGQYFDGRKPKAIPAKLEFDGSELTVTSEIFSETYLKNQLKISPRIGRADRFITFPNGTQVKCSDDTFLDSLPQESQTEGIVAWFEERWIAALAGVIIIISTLLAGYFYGLPILANLVVPHMPLETEHKLGEQALNWLDNNKWFKPTKLDQNKQIEISNAFDQLINDLPTRKYYLLKFRDTSFMGPNAMALPGGMIIITDAMVNEAQSQEEVLAVLSHEIGHVELRHTMRSVLQDSVIGIVTTAISSDAASLSLAVAGLPALVAQTKYSREFETEADEYAFGLLKQKGYSPLAFASIMERLAKQSENDVKPFTFLSSHPVTADRVKRARSAAGQ